MQAKRASPSGGVRMRHVGRAYVCACVCACAYVCLSVIREIKHPFHDNIISLNT